MKTINATELQVGDRVIRAFTILTVGHVHLRLTTVEDSDTAGSFFPGVYVDWAEGGSTKFRLAATVDVES